MDFASYHNRITFMKHLLIDLALTFTIVPAVLIGIFYINATGCKKLPVHKAKPNTVERKALKPIEAYVQRFKDVAQDEQDKFGIPASISLAQGILESGIGESELASEYNNHFGIKCFKKGCSTFHCVTYKDDSPRDRFRSYSSAWQSWRDHSLFLSRGQYASLRGKSFTKYALGLQRIGYATKKSYASDLIAVIEDNNLQRFDK